MIIYRDSLSQLSYSVEEIYGIQEDRESQKYHKARQVYNSFYHIYNLHEAEAFQPDSVITEDSNAGFAFFSVIYPDICVSANGKSNIPAKAAEAGVRHHRILAIVDGAAFGADIQRFMQKAKSMDADCLLYAPESFEYLLLSSGVVEVPDEIIETPYDYADTRQYASWEQFFTSYLAVATQNTIYQYSKTKLPPAWLTAGNVKKIKEQIPDMLT